MSDDADAYAVLQVVADADPDVVRAAYRALARRYHPDGSAPNPSRMAAINGAYEQIGSQDARARYDASRRRVVAVGPGHRPSTPASDPWTGGPLSRRVASARDGGPIIDFGRYAGWRIADLARHDPDYLRWLSRHSTGVRYREAIERSLPGDEELGRRASTVS